MADTLSTLRGDRKYNLAGESAPKGVRLRAAVAGPDSFGMGLQILVAEWERSARPPVDAIRRLHSQRLGKKVFPLIVAIANEERSVWLMGPNPDASPVGPLPEPQAARILQASLDELSGLAARQRIAHLLRSLSSSDIVGVTNSGLFASHYLTSVLQDETEWEPAGLRARDWLNMRDEPLIDALGFSARRAAANALVLTTDSTRPRAVAVLLNETEAFDADSPRFSVSPVAYGLSVAQREEAPWLIVLRGSQIRLFPARPGVGVGSRGQAETYFELDLALVSAEHAAYLDLAFSATALGADGTIRQLLDGSTRYATGLGERLRQRVYEEAIPKLAVAVAHELERLGHPASDDYSYAYRITLRILFRLLFQAYAEDSGLLPYGRNDRYTRNSLNRWALDLVEQPDLEFDPHSHAIWDDLTQVWDVIDTGNTTWDVPAYNGGLFGTDPDLHPAGAVIAAMQLNDVAVGHVLRHLLVDDTVEGEVGAVDFRALSVREFGTIYEGLLESSLSRADQNLTLDEKNAYLPAGDSGDVVVTAGEVYYHNASGERKATGSYFTPHFAVEHLLERALEPALDQHLERIARLLETGDQAGATEQFFDFRVADLAMGSGHFLVSAIDRIEAGMAAFLVDHELPGVTDEFRRLEATAKANLGDAAPDFEIEPSALLRRQIARRCIYGLDINDIAVELARVAVWIHTFVPGLPMSTLDHNLVEANSLTGIGTITEAIEALDPSHKSGQLSIYSGPILDALEEAKKLLTAAANASEATKAEVRQSAEIHRKAREAAQPTKLLFDGAVAVRTGIVDSLIGLDVDAIRQEADRPDVAARIAELQAGHMPYLFPEVFRRTNPGFDVLIGNPPWEEATIEENGFWTLHYPGLKRGMTAAKQEAEIIRLRTERADLHAEFKERQQVVERIRKALTAGPFPGMGTGDPDYYKAFVWRFWNLARERGRAGVVLPRSVFTAAGSKEWRLKVLTEGAFTEVSILLNTRGWVFDDLEHRDYVALVAVDKHGQSDTMPYRGPFDSLEAFNAGVQLEPARFIVEDYLTWTENASLPLLPSPEAVDVFLKLRAHPRLAQEGDWTVRPYAELHATNDKLSKGGVIDVDSSGRPGEWPVYKGESFNLWEPETGVVYGWAEPDAAVERLQTTRLRASRNRRSVFSQLERDRITKSSTLDVFRPRLAFRDVTHATNSRTLVVALVPPRVLLANKAPTIVWIRGNERDEAYLLGVMSSIPLDWYARKIVKTQMNFHLFRAFPVPRPGRDSALRREVEVSAGRLAAIDDRYADWAEAVGVEVGSVGSGDEKFDLIARLDAAVSHLYGLEEHHVVHIFETFHRGWDHTERLTAVLEHYVASRARTS